MIICRPTCLTDGILTTRTPHSGKITKRPLLVPTECIRLFAVTDAAIVRVAPYFDSFGRATPLPDALLTLILHNILLFLVDDAVSMPILAMITPVAVTGHKVFLPHPVRPI